MKRTGSIFTYSTAAVIAALFFFMTTVLWGPSMAQAQAGAAAPASEKVSKSDRTEARINDLHTKLKITQAQEEQWNKVAEVMRENAASMDPLIKARKEKSARMNAVDDLKSYSQISDVHAEGLKKFIAVFEVLYASMSDEQKKTADAIFMKHGHQKKAKKK